ncbi:MAG: hypothetical protein JKY65_14575 [Planctomycetes bacterium]|nr:hypothetical protein [Planctomycetota bacterium]
MPPSYSPKHLITRRRATGRLLLLLLLPLISSGCTVFGDYNVATHEAREAFMAGHFDQAVAKYSEGLEVINDSLLYRLEAGMSAHVGQDYERSFQLFDRAYRRVVEYQDRALLNAANVGQQIGRILVNEKTAPYEGEVFEQILLQAYQAKNVFIKGDREGVVTEALRCMDIQDKARRLYEEELRTTEAEATKQTSSGEGFDAKEVDAEMRKAYSYPNQGELNTAEAVYDMRYVRYLIAFLRDAVATSEADYNSALIDMKFVADTFGAVPFVQRELARLTRLSGDREGAKIMREEAGLQPLPRGAGSVTLFLEAGTAPMKRQFKMIFPTYSGAAAFAMPIYEPTRNPIRTAILEVGGQQSEALCLTDLQEVAFRYHRDRLPLMIARQIIRLAAKIGLQEGGRAVIANTGSGVASQAGALAWTISASVWNVVSEQADLRCWRTLPRTLSVTRIYLPPGDYPARLILLNDQGAQVGVHELGEIRIATGRHRMINARTLGTTVHSDLSRESYDPMSAAVPEPPK